MKIYVKLRDKGTIFHDGSGNQSITGSLPVEVTLTPKIKNAMQKGRLEKVSDEEAKAIIAKANKNDETKKQALKSESSKISKLEAALEAKQNELVIKDEAVTQKDEEIANLKETIAQGSEGAITAEQFKEVQDALTEANKIVEKLTEANGALTLELEEAVSVQGNLRAELAKSKKK